MGKWVNRTVTSKWVEEVPNIKNMTNEGKSIAAIAKHYGKSKQRMYQIFDKYGIPNIERERKNTLKGKSIEYYWLNRILTSKGIPKQERVRILENLEIPTHCPCLNLELKYDGTGIQGFSREDCSPSLDKIYPDKGYVLENIQIISWRANRIKNDSTPDEILKIAEYIKKITT